MRKEIIPIERIAQSILYLRGQKVLLDRDLAALYGVETRVLNQAVKRNSDRFPDDFVFMLSREEIARISQTVTSSAKLKFSRQVRAFTEQGVAMLSTVLNSERAVKVNIAIMRAFVKLRETLAANRQLARKFEELERRIGKHDKDIAAVIEAIRQLMLPSEQPRREIGFHVREQAARYRIDRPRRSSLLTG
jgi:ORF6N domain